MTNKKQFLFEKTKQINCFKEFFSNDQEQKNTDYHEAWVTWQDIKLVLIGINDFCFMFIAFYESHTVHENPINDAHNVKCDVNVCALSASESK